LHPASCILHVLRASCLTRRSEHQIVRRFFHLRLNGTRAETQINQRQVGGVTADGDIQQGVKEKKAEDFRADLLAAIRQQEFDKTDAGKRFARLAAFISPLLAAKVLFTIGQSASKFKLVFLQALFQAYKAGRGVTGQVIPAFEGILSLQDGLSGRLIDGALAYAVIAAQFAGHPALRHLVTSLRPTCFRLSVNSAIRVLRGLFEMRRVKTGKDANGKRHNAWQLVPDNPLIEYDTVELPADVSQILESFYSTLFAKSETPLKTTFPVETAIAEEFDDWTYNPLAVIGGTRA
jgi:hypothetical protein